MTEYKTINFERSALGGSGEPTGLAKLLQIQPVDLGRGLVTLNDGVFTIGRDPECDLQISEDSVSRKHASIERLADGSHLIRDLGSTNGTWVDKKPVSRQLLKSDDRIRIGNRIFRFISDDGVEADYFEAVYSMMTKDGLTGAMNRRIFLDMLNIELKRRRRSGSSLCLMMIDVDHFKSINDEYGHPVGDEVLVELAGRIRNGGRDEDLFARYGGEEFIAALCGCQKQDGIEVAERWRKIIADTPIETKAGPLNCSVSIGLAVIEGNQSSIEALDLIESADKKLYEAKKAGRNVVAW